MSEAAATRAKKPNLVSVLISQIRPAPQNEQVYRPVRLNDPEIRKLAQSIEEHGLQEPLVITRDSFIISGHRRHAACRLIGMYKVPCIVRDDVGVDDPEFMTLLVENNRQRVKNLSEVIRETVVCTNGDNAYEALLNYRKAKARVDGEFMPIGTFKQRERISRAKRPMLDAALRIINTNRQYWPLADRLIHYNMLNDPPLRHSAKPDSRYRNDKPSYHDLCTLLVRARLTGVIPFAAIGDKTRTVVTWSNLYSEVGEFVTDQLDDFLKGYWRNLQQSQPNHVEIVGEKNTLLSAIEKVASEFCIPYTIARGYCSLDPLHRLSQRYKFSGKDNLIILVTSDHDPEGVDIPHAIARTMRDDFGIPDTQVKVKKVFLTPEQVRERNISTTFDAKTAGKRYKKFKAEYGPNVYEVEALPIAEQAKLLREGIESVLDIDAYNAEVEAQKEDAARLEAFREKAADALADIMEDEEDDVIEDDES
jgi:hypothetical protein